MSNPNSAAPQIAANPTEVMGVGLAPVAFADPKAYPHGLEVVVFVPGQLEPLGKSALPPGCALVAMDPAGSAMFVAQVRKAMGAARRTPGQINAPGLPQ
jgi:hypothetical protein